MPKHEPMRNRSWTIADHDNLKSFEVDDPKAQTALKAEQDNLSFYIGYFKEYSGEGNFEFFLKT